MVVYEVSLQTFKQGTAVGNYNYQVLAYVGVFYEALVTPTATREIKKGNFV